LAAAVSWSQPLSWSLPSSPGPCPALLPPPPDLSPHQATLRHWPKHRSSSLSAPGCLQINQQKIHPSVLLAHASDQEQLLSSGKPDGSVCHFGLSGFNALRSSCPAGGRRIHNGRLVHTSPRRQNPQQVLTILDGSASTVVPMVRITPPKEVKADTSSMEVPTAQTLVT
jgi:hypothetical protein